MPQRTRPPPGFFFELAGGGFNRRFAGLDLPHRDFPAPASGDEPVPPDQ